jgi:hypothetical protein
MTTPCNLSYKEVGPFPQTLFLGCSIQNITQNLSWGAEPSSCRVTLVKDTSSHPSDPTNTVLNTSISTVVNNTNPSNVFNTLNLDGTDTGKTLHKNLANREQEIESRRVVDDINNTVLIRNKDTGKKCWNPHDFNANPIPWVGPDPGFIGDQFFVGRRLFNTVGVPCHIRFDDVMFGGLLKSWEFDGSKYNVELIGPGGLLKGTTLVINDYAGSVSTLLPQTDSALGFAPLSIPSNNTTDPNNIFYGNIVQGNMPNFINIFGYNNFNYGFNRTLVSSRGANAAQIYDTLIELLNKSDGSIARNQFSPYGGIVTKSLAEYTKNPNSYFMINPQHTILTYGSTSINFTQLGILSHKLSMDGFYRPIFRLDLSQVPRPDPGLYINANTITLDGFIDFCCKGVGFDWSVELIPDLISSNFTGRILIRTYNRNIQPPPNVLKNFLTTFNADNRVVSYNLGEEYNEEPTRKVVVGGKQRRLIQLMTHTLSKYRNTRVFDMGLGVFWPVDGDMQETYLSAGNQRNTARYPNPSSTRAFDVSYGPSYRIYNGAATAQNDNDFLSIETLEYSGTNVIKGNYITRKPRLRGFSPTLTGANPDFYIPPIGTATAPFGGGGGSGASTGGSTSYPIQYDLISQFFGLNKDKSPRRVFYDRKMRQLQVNVSLGDLRSFFPQWNDAQFSGYVTIYENEIRAALAGYDSWKCYEFDPVPYGFKTPLVKLIYSYINLVYGSNVANTLMLTAWDTLGVQAKFNIFHYNFGDPGHPINPNAATILSNDSQGLVSLMQGVHGFLANELGKHYGQDFLVRLPRMRYRVDNTGEYQYSYSITDSAWEENGNFLDDTMQIGSSNASVLANTDGRFGPILGYNASAEMENRIPEFLEGSFGDPTSFGYGSTPTRGDVYGSLPMTANGVAILRMKSFHSMVSTSQFGLTAPAAGMYDPWYFPLIDNLDPAKVLLIPHAKYQTSILQRIPLQIINNPSNPVLTDSFGRIVPPTRAYKLYQKCSMLDVLPENENNKNIIYAPNIGECAVISAPSKIEIAGVRSCPKTLVDDLLAAMSQGSEIASEQNGFFELVGFFPTQWYPAWNARAQASIYAAGLGSLSPGNPQVVGSRPLMTPLALMALACAMDYLTLLDLPENRTAFSALGQGQDTRHLTNLAIFPRCAMPNFAAIPIEDNLSVYGPWTSHPGLIAPNIFPSLDTQGSNTSTNNIVGGVEVEINPEYVPWEYGGMDNLDRAVLTTLGDSNRYQQVQEKGTITLAGMLLVNSSIGSRILSNYGPVCNSINVEAGNDGFKTTYSFRTYSRRIGYFNKDNADNIQKFGKLAISFKKETTDFIMKQLQNNLKGILNNNWRNPFVLNMTNWHSSKTYSFSPVTILVGGAGPGIHHNSNLADVDDKLSFFPGWYSRPAIPPDTICNPQNMLYHYSKTSIYDETEVCNEIFNDPQSYNTKSVMSLDGLISPISFYPNPFGSTFPITFYPRSKCPYCHGLGLYTYKKFPSAVIPQTYNVPNLTSILTNSTINCPFCILDTAVSGIKAKSAQPTEVTPPYLIASGTDNAIISDRNNSSKFKSSKINTYTLNPMVMSAPNSDFSISSNKQDTDLCGHSIGVVSYGNVSPGFIDDLRAFKAASVGKNFNDYDINLIQAGGYSQAFQNVRFFGLRGPLMVHGWGYDLEGFPVPNSSGEYKFDDSGKIIRKADGTPVFKNQQLQSDGSYSIPYKENSFYKGWAQQPGSWPVGPVDLRWDDNARVWTVGSNYKPVWIVIEHDLLNNEPVRGIILESSYNNSPLPSGLRKLVFVKDTPGMFSSPRGAALYCRYDSQNGFYEPIYNRPLVTSGTINGSNTATIYKAYTPPSVVTDLTLPEAYTVLSYQTSFDNPLEINTPIGNNALFTFLNGKWTLQAIKT